ncbi:hypothetical protein SADUNF_Sadunf08G0064500 [Salix dunnii]|uniref:Uncharacterized protein n=1 Tax=Salix dunnii TaxID=1413687 RepID=A0A835JYS8_9ROSI|nr:hypothetical protein SADUNF_Sadunf08G0064500 [Salix dunnii]
MDGRTEVQLGMNTANIETRMEKGRNYAAVRDINRVFDLVNVDLSCVAQMATNLTGVRPHLEAVAVKCRFKIGRECKLAFILADLDICCC